MLTSIEAHSATKPEHFTSFHWPPEMLLTFPKNLFRGKCGNGASLCKAVPYLQCETQAPPPAALSPFPPSETILLKRKAKWVLCRNASGEFSKPGYKVLRCMQPQGGHSEGMRNSDLYEELFWFPVLLLTAFHTWLTLSSTQTVFSGVTFPVMKWKMLREGRDRGGDKLTSVSSDISSLSDSPVSSHIPELMPEDF